MIQIDSGVFVKSRMETGDCFIFMEMEFAGLEINAGHQSVISKYLPQTRKTLVVLVLQINITPLPVTVNRKIKKHRSN